MIQKIYDTHNPSALNEKLNELQGSLLYLEDGDYFQ